MPSTELDIDRCIHHPSLRTCRSLHPLQGRADLCLGSTTQDPTGSCMHGKAQNGMHVGSSACTLVAGFLANSTCKADCLRRVPPSPKHTRPAPDSPPPFGGPTWVQDHVCEVVALAALHGLTAHITSSSSTQHVARPCHACMEQVAPPAADTKGCRVSGHHVYTAGEVVACACVAC
jgi:hypothetical protein